MKETWSSMKSAINRRSFVKNGVTMAGAATLGTGLLAGAPSLMLIVAERPPTPAASRIPKRAGRARS